MTSEQVRTVCSVAADSSTSVKQYLEKPNDRATRLKALHDAKRLVTELQDAEDALFAPLEQGVVAYTLRLVMSIGALEKIPESGSITAAKLAAAVGSDKSLIVRVMRVLVATGIFEEVKQDEYAHTRLSMDFSTPGYAPYYEVMVDDMFYTFSRLPEYFNSHPLEAPSSPTHNPFSWVFGMEGQDWATVISRTPENGRKLSNAMSARWSGLTAIGAYPFDTELSYLSEIALEQDRVFIVDIGGAHGGSMKQIRQAYPSLKGRIIIQELARTIDQVPADFLPAELDIHHQVHDFWTPQPIRGAGVYYISRVLHDWPDNLCKKLLQHIVDAMDPDSKLLIAETVVPDRVQKEELYCYWMDLTMMTFGGKERTETDWRDMFEELGVELVKIWKPVVGTFSTIEGRLRKEGGKQWRR